MTEQDSIKRKVQEQFGKHAQKYVTSSTHSKGSDLALLPEWLQLQPESIVLDIATGGGHVVKALAPHAASVFAADLTYQMLKTARRHLDPSYSNIHYVVADAESLPFLENTFDAVTCRIAPHHFPHPDKFVKEAARVLKPGGKFLLIDNIAPADKELDEFVNRLEKLRDESHMRSYSVKEWSTWFEQAGLTLVKAESRKKTFNYPEWVERTTTSEEQIKKVDKHLLSASKSILDYFSIEISEDMIQSLTIDEWMALTVKK
ncbi:class I SAM-dependent methyltransferase [Peribacillus cavernae]|uniref:Class I SAM-dependent methyltransferase n=1 Tax=Peribacillus cavernae TaxID=1674310 RepID=A0A433HIG5_9BACI|nr:class I SAM-dependent methyltransferase [Peribacillus cavernae]MDQ0217662.1 ubiquinone/menaquinone biosynthesis C-methylase UbiE [Peribacillus cavernae]RUQ28137.1 class I SAM-dependent methyltransferase [Peribacillus cavernae]